MFVTGCEPLADLGNNFSEFNKSIRSLSLPFSEIRGQHTADELSKGVKKQVPVNRDAKIEGDFSCRTERYKAAAEYNENILLDPKTDVFYPGAIIKGESIESGEYIPIVADRTPITFSISLENIDTEDKTGNKQSVSRTVKPILSEVREGFRDILAQKVTGSTPAKISFEIKTVRSSEELRLAIGAAFSYSGGLASVGLDASFDYTKSNVQSRTLLKYVQVYYSWDLNIDKANPSDWFKNPDKVKLSQTSGMPIYISSVN